MEARGKLRPSLRERVEARSEDDVLPDAAGRLVGDQILDEAGAGDDGGAEGPREVAHVRTISPSRIGGSEPQAHLVFEHVRRRVDVYVKRAPQRRPHRRAVGGHHTIRHLAPRTAHADAVDAASPLHPPPRAL